MDKFNKTSLLGLSSLIILFSGIGLISYIRMLKMSDSYDVLMTETPVIEKLYHSQTISESIKSNVADLLNTGTDFNLDRRVYVRGELKKDLRRFEEITQVIDYLSHENGRADLNQKMQTSAGVIVNLCSKILELERVPILEYKKIQAAQNRFISHSKELIAFQNDRLLKKSLKAKKIARESTNFILIFSLIGILIFGTVIFSLVKMTKHLQHVNQALKKEKNKAEKASRAKTEFLSNVSHELRTPLNVVIGYSNLLLQGKPRKDQVEDIKTLRFSAKSLLMLIEDLLDITRIEQGKIKLEIKTFNFKALVRRIYNAHKVNAAQKTIDFKVSIDDNIPDSLLGDHVRLGQVISNLLTNAIKFTEKGFIHMKLDLLEQNTSSSRLKLCVIDSGIGIPQDKLKTIFKRFNQADTNISRVHAGVGLGLSIATGLLETMDSTIHVSSEENIGSTFSFELTLEKSNTSLDHPDQLKPRLYNEDTLHNKKILMVEDNQMNIIIGKKFLEKWGVEVDIAEDGLQALEMFKSNFYDLILMDLHLPKMDGISATHEIRKMERKTGNHIPIIALTAAGEQGIKEETLKKGMNDFIAKPFDPQLLFTKINDLIS